ncbi:Na(+)-translocating NADH-quinone reductase subunit A [Capnocytophaga canimorsus]|uniref:Na(+)-translocating NADH-quinone reductase subunit A n=1 Tax=Capnocytophaga canimorsus TaxID=28188 RepID=A0A0B7HD32_9FLAO|nr:Na(+)-translocating NADH-quinone reductase subunit A [Capnocytophaga canimorsus]ATA76139.1 NADH:ubiquinone reductase (Na(+)-transporting) subunit A [Capnocytophaga canimorsus]PJI80339.1 Na+-transporting NADH:ubiquinone oxidoreductase subunit A [Capnocytophaga canimorsus]CEN35488.1 Na(+)-translocating NADH-quinone reductase subunit A [Capnocytophaga canimorsus]STA71246.1 Na(+)-translocating NADH-quinone reductase subunit A [Capnocytophaga canimorsus]
MSNDIRIRKGLDIHLEGEAEKITRQLPLAKMYGLKPSDFHSVVPKLIAKEGTEVKAGEAVFHDKKDERVLFPSPVSGKIAEIVRGERRKILEIKILPDTEQVFKDFGSKDPAKMSAEQIKDFLLSTGAWTFIKQRPYDVIANPDDKPKAIFVSACKTNPLAPDYDYALKGKEVQLQVALSALAKLTTGKVHVSVFKDSSLSPFRNFKDIVLHNVSGPHPAGNVSTQIAKIDPINKGEVVWVVTPQDLVVMGELFLTGKLNLTRTLALTGACVEKPQYVSVIAGAQVDSVVSGNLKKEKSRVISGDVLTGKKVSEDGFLGYYDDQVTAIPEGDDYEFFGWNKPVFNKISTTRAMTFSWLNPKKKYNLNTNTNGEHRAFVMTGMYEEVFPLDIYPMQLLKACLYKDLDELENLGAYEVAPEDFALTEFVCVSKQPHQKIIREGLDLMIQELG